MDKNHTEEKQADYQSVQDTPDELIDIEIAKLESKLKHKGSRLGFFLFVGGCILSSLTYAAFGKPIFANTPLANGPFSVYSFPIGVGLVMYFLFAFAYVTMLRNVRERQIYQDIEVLNVRKRALSNPQNPGTPLSYFDRLVNINVSNLEAYYSMVKIHTNNSFIASVTAGGIGFLLILTGLVVGFSGFSNSNTIAYISTGSGVITEFIASIFFYLYNSTTRQLKDYHDSLIDVQNVLLSFKIVEDTSDADTKMTMMKSMIESLIKGKRT